MMAEELSTVMIKNGLCNLGISIAYPRSDAETLGSPAPAVVPPAAKKRLTFYRNSRFRLQFPHFTGLC